MSGDRTLSRQQLRAMEAGRRRADRERRKNARRRVARFRAWLGEGSPMRRIPEIPSDADYRLAGERR